ncbi:helix-hairpin-helix domain-containing protein [Pedobacter psychroterrae]|uniref:helix-hairpin-helix domain-containing protein n=1 Tax=Pedobacter psychroterrae TaxID=2530453 RepID=UPI001CED3B94|nr:helix-hairpin-helix domain-containing protein [Pedobacter psychroterrae]
MAIRKLFILLFILFSCDSCMAQEDELIKDIVESFAENLSEDYDLSELIEQLHYLRKHPINLNNTRPAELKKLVFLSALQISNLFAHLNSNGKLIDVLELQGINGFDAATITRIIPFVRIGQRTLLADATVNDLIKSGNNDLMLRYGQIIQTQKGFKDLPGSRYLGSAEKLLLRYRYSYVDAVSISLVAEKDAGEQLWRGAIGLDHLSGNIGFYNLNKVVDKVIVGDYALQFGQGLTLWSGFAFGKGPDVTSVASKDVGLRPYSSSNEASFLRGIASTLHLNRHVALTPFVSFRKLDASLKFPAEGGATLQNINISGLHRTLTELKNQKSLKQNVYGGALKYVSSNLHIGLVGYHSIYQHEFITGTQLYNKYAFIGKKLFNTGAHYNYTLGNIYLYGEAAHSVKGGWAIVNGAMTSLSPKVSVVLLFRNYDRDYHSFLSNGVGEGSEISNEKGWYAGINYSPDKRWMFSVYSDYFKFPWLRYRVDAPSSGYEALGQAAFTPKKTFKLLLRYKREVKQQNPEAGTEEKILLVWVNKQNFRMEANWKMNKKFSFQQRAELINYQKGRAADEWGYLIYQDINYHPLSAKLSANIRIAYFNTPSYNSRIYAFEDDVLYGSSFGGYNGKGIRTFVNLRYRLLRQMDLWARYALYAYQDRIMIGSGLDEIPGSKKSDFKLQVRYQF